MSWPRERNRRLTAASLSFALALMVSTGCRRHAQRLGRPHVLLITLDTTRADRLGCYGYPRTTTPNLDALATESVVYTRAVATSSWTLPSHASLLTGKLPSSHGAQYDAEGPLSLASAVEGPEDWRRYRVRPLAEGERTLAEILREAGYATGAVVAGPWLKRPFGLAQGFDYYDDDQIDSSDGRRAEQVTAPALSWLDRNRGKPLFLFLNYYDPHGPYSAPEPFGHAFLEAGAPLSAEPSGDELQARYDAELRYMDHHVGTLLRGLKQRGLFEDSLVVVAADHGELLGEQGRLGHGRYLSEPELHIPLLVKQPRREVAASRSEARIQLTDVFAIVLARAGLPLPEGLQAGTPPGIGHPVVAEVYPLAWDSADGDWRALYEGSRKFLWNSKGQHALFDLAQDPGEQHNLAASERERVWRLSALLESYLTALPPPGAAGPRRALDEETLRALKGLGYVR